MVFKLTEAGRSNTGPGIFVLRKRISNVLHEGSSISFGNFNVARS